MGIEETELTVVCYVRAPLVREPVEAKIETLQACESEGYIDMFVLRSWPDKVTLEEDTSPHQEVIDVFKRFEQWADHRGVSVRPPFEVRTTTSFVTGKTKKILVTPLISLALYHDEQLIGVFPHSADETTDTVTEAITALQNGELPTPLGVSPAPDVTSSTICPDCGGFLMNGQGLFACTDCEWVGIATSDGRYKPIFSEASRLSPQ
jgi:hypothetical protein